MGAAAGLAGRPARATLLGAAVQAGAVVLATHHGHDALQQIAHSDCAIVVYGAGLITASDSVCTADTIWSFETQAPNFGSAGERGVRVVHRDARMQLEAHAMHSTPWRGCASSSNRASKFREIEFCKFFRILGPFSLDSALSLSYIHTG